MMKGINSLSQSSFPVASPLADFPLTAWGEAYGNCGSFFQVGCLNVSEHKGMNLDGVNMEGKAYLERHKVSCHRPLCPTCWSDWANRETDRAVQRLDAFVLKGRSLKLIHVVVGVPTVDYGLSLQKMREKVYRVLKAVHCLGGMLVYHPKRMNKNTKIWYFHPHFHVLGYGWLTDPRKNYFASGYVVRNYGVRKTVHGTIFYELSHCGISPDHHTVTWFGALSYGKLHVKYDEKDDATCPLCHEKLRRLMWIGKGVCPLPDVEGVTFFDDPDNWIRWKFDLA